MRQYDTTSRALPLAVLPYPEWGRAASSSALHREGALHRFARPPGIGQTATGSIVGAGIDLAQTGAGAAVGGQDVAKSIVLSAPAAVGTIVGGFAASGATWATAAIPVVGPIVAGVTIALMAIFGRKGPKQKVATTEIVDKVEPLLQQNLDGYLSGPRTCASKEQAIANFYAGWQYVLDNCGAAVMGDPGQRCISERQEGAHPMWEGCAPNCPNWFQLYLDPIRNDQCTSDMVDANGNVIPGAGILSGGGLDTGSLMLAGAGVLLLMAVMGDKR